MARNGSGTFNLLTNSWSPATNGTPATAADWQALINDVAAAITQSLSKDGQTALTGNLPAGGNKITGLAAGTSSGDSVRWDQLSGIGLFKNLQASANGTSANITVTTDEIVVEDSSNQCATLRNVSLTIAGTSVGANGLDAGTINTSTWYSVWVIWDGTTTAGLLSTSATAPTLPGVYTHKTRVGWIRTDATANKYPLAFKQYGREVRYVVGAGTNVTALPIMATGASGSIAVPTWTSLAWATFVPSTAAAIHINAFANNGIVIAAPNNSYGAYNSTTNAPPVVNGGNSGSILYSTPAKLMLESSNIYYAVSTGGQIYAMGWEDSL